MLVGPVRLIRADEVSSAASNEPVAIVSLTGGIDDYSQARSSTSVRAGQVARSEGVVIDYRQPRRAGHLVDGHLACISSAGWHTHDCVHADKAYSGDRDGGDGVQ